MNRIIKLFIDVSMFQSQSEYRHARLITKSSILTSLFSGTYIFLSEYFGYDKGVYLMIFNFVGLALVPFTFKLRGSIALTGNLYIVIGASAVIVLTYFSGGMWSALYPWIISIPILAMMVLNRKYAIIWAVFSFLVMQYFFIAELMGTSFPVEYNLEFKTVWYSSVISGLFLILITITLVFEHNRNSAVKSAINKNHMLRHQKKRIEIQSNELKQVIEDKDTLNKIMAHDLKNPIGNILGLSHLLRDSKLSEEEKDRYISLIEQSAHKSNKLIHKVLNSEENNKDIYDIKLGKHDLSNLLDENIELVSEMAFTKSIQMIKNSSFDKCISLIDPTYFSLIIENILSNAIKFSDKGKNIIIDLKKVNNMARISIQDQGPGFSEEDKLKMFGQFERLSAKPTGGESSTGLGLSLVKKYIELLNGKVWCDSQLGKGSTFHIEFNLAS